MLNVVSDPTHIAIGVIAVICLVGFLARLNGP
jgi:hypothetical protein